MNVAAPILTSEMVELSQLGYAIESHPHFGSRLLGTPDRLIADDLKARLAVGGGKLVIGSEILVF